MATFRMPALPPRTISQPVKVEFVTGGQDAGVSIQPSALSGIADLISAMPKAAQDAAGYEVSAILGEVIEDARENYVPYKDGYLRDSAGWDEYNPNSTATITRLGAWFGAPASEAQLGKATRAFFEEGLNIARPERYAFEQHENLSYDHPNLGVVTNPQAKYLERPFLAAEPSIVPRIANAVSAVWGGSGGHTGPEVDENTNQSWWQIMDVPTTSSGGPR